MAKKGAVETGSDEGGFDDVAAALEGAIGKSVDRTMNVSRFISTGFKPLDFAISSMKDGGGLPSGRICEISGPSAVGKTQLATQLMIETQKIGGVSVLADHERSFALALARRLGLDTSPGRWSLIQPRTFEASVQSFMRGTEAIRKIKGKRDIPVTWIVDSLASMIPQSQLSKEADEQTMADQVALARATSLHFKTLALIAEEMDVLLVFLNQVRTKPGVVYGDNLYTSGGDAPKYYSSVRIMLSARQLSEGSGEDKEVVGNAVSAKIIKNKVARPHLKTSWAFKYREDGTGYVDLAGSYLDILINKGVLESAHGQRVVWVDGSKPFKKKLADELNASPDGIRQLEQLWLSADMQEDAEPGSDEE